MTPYNRNLIDTAGIAELLMVSRQHVTDKITKRTDFPKPAIDVSRRIRYWRIDDVRDYVRKARVPHKSRKENVTC